MRDWVILYVFWLITQVLKLMIIWTSSDSEIYKTRISDF